MNYINLDHGYWTKAYAEGYAELLASEREKARYCCISHCIMTTPPHNSVLDLGCGAGLLSDYLSIGRYTGVDIAENAICEAAMHRKGSFICASAESYVPDSAYDVIVFNESLYYLPNPKSVLWRYQTYLSDQGYFIVSLFQPPFGHRSYDVLKGLTEVVRNMKGFEISEMRVMGDELHWQLFSLRPAGVDNASSPYMQC